MPDGERRCGDCFAYMHGFGASILSKCGVVDIRAVYTAVFHYVYGGRFGLNIKCRQVRQAQVCFDRDRNRSANVDIQDNLRVIERDLSRYRFGRDYERYRYEAFAKCSYADCLVGSHTSACNNINAQQQECAINFQEQFM